MTRKKTKIQHPVSAKKSKNNKRAVVSVKETALKVSGVTTRQRGFSISKGKRKQAGRDAKSAIKQS